MREHSPARGTHPRVFYAQFYAPERMAFPSGAFLFIQPEQANNKNHPTRTPATTMVRTSVRYRAIGITSFLSSLEVRPAGILSRVLSKKQAPACGAR